MRLGVIARADNGGLGNLTWEFCRHLHPDRVLVMDLGEYGRSPVHLDRYEGLDVRVVEGLAPTADDRAWLLDGCDVLYCADAETEVLSRRGWLSHDQLTTEDEVLTLTAEHLSEWQPVRAVNVFPAAPRRMLSIESRGHSSLTTEDHRWFVERNVSGGKWRRKENRVVTSSKLTSSDKIPRSAPCVNLPHEPKWSDALVELVAWFYTEGFVRGSSSVTIVQSHQVNAPNCARIRAALTALFGPSVSALPRNGNRQHPEPLWREKRGERNIVWHLNGTAGAVLCEHAPGKVPTLEFVQQLTRAQLALFVDVSMLADNNGPRAFSQKDPARVDAFELACILLGRGVSRRDNDRGMTTIGLYKSPHMHVGMARREWVEHNGIVWCPTTANGSWLARRRGTVFYTGNSAETWYADELPVEAAAAGVRTVLHVMPELWTPNRIADQLWLPTTYRRRLVPGGVLVPVPVATDRFTPAVRAPARHFVAVWAPAMLDRNGTDAVLAALELIRSPVRVTVLGAQRNVDLHDTSPIDLSCRPGPYPDAYFDLWPDDADVLLMPRRYAGLSMPVQEAAARGMPAVMTGCEPQTSWPGVLSIPFRGRPSRHQMAGGLVDVHDPDPVALARAVETLAGDDELAGTLSRRALAWAEALSWDVWAPRYRKLLGLDG